MNNLKLDEDYQMKELKISVKPVETKKVYDSSSKSMDSNLISMISAK
jgi:hypothetical protein